ncbi:MULTISPECIES: hypothetical protein [unclassified Pantoea]
MSKRKKTLVLVPFIISFAITGCIQREVVVNHVQDVTGGDRAQVRIVGFTSDTMMWGGFDCNQPYQMPPKGYYPEVRKTDESIPAYIDKGFKKSKLPEGLYPLDRAEYYVRAGKLLGVWPSKHLSDGRLCGNVFAIRPEKDKLYEFRNRNDDNMCYFELYEINKSTGAATRMNMTTYVDVCHK